MAQPSAPARASRVAAHIAGLAGAGLRAEALRTHYQPLVDLHTDEVAAHEALLRGPEGTAFETPIAMIGHARDRGLGAALDCTSLGVHLANAGAQLPGPVVPLFVNIEPDTLAVALDDVLDLISSRPPNVAVVAELTERSLTANPAAVHRAVNALRSIGCPIAFDDVGVDAGSLALIPVLRPEVVKLDMRVLRDVGDAGAVAVAHAARAYAERTGADVVAEGIETARDRARAMALGATLGQGWFWGRASATPATEGLAPRSITASAPRPQTLRTPFDLLPSGATQVATRSTLLEISRDLEHIALGLRVPPVVLTCLQDAGNFSRPTRELYASLAARLPLVGVAGVGMPSVPAPGVRGADIALSDPIRQEWVVIVIGPFVSTAIIGRARPPSSSLPGAEPEFDYTVTYEPARVAEAARLVLDRFAQGLPAPSLI